MAQSKPLGLQVGAIDVHAHYLPPRYRVAALAHGQAKPDGMPELPEWDAVSAVALMDRVGISTAMLSISSPGVAFIPQAAERAVLAHDVNDDGAEAVTVRPERFGLLATLPLPFVEESLLEISHAFDDLHADGVCLHTHYDGVYLGDPRLDPVFAELDRRGAVVTIHPVSPVCWEAVSFGRPRPIIEFLLDTTRAVANMALSGTLDRFPNIRLVVPHAGAALPVLADRIGALGGLLAVPGESRVDVVAALRLLHYDLAGIALPRALPALLNLVDHDRLLYGSDYPFTPANTVATLADAISGHLNEPLLAGTLRSNALKLFPRLRLPADQDPLGGARQ